MQFKKNVTPRILVTVAGKNQSMTRILKCYTAASLTVLHFSENKFCTE